MTELEAMDLIGLLFAAYPNARVDPRTVAVYRSRVMGLEASVAKVAIDRLIDTKNFPPTIAEIMAAAGEVRDGRIASAPDAYDAVCMAVRMIGRYAPLPLRNDEAWRLYLEERRKINPTAPSLAAFELDERSARAVRALGGWLELCNSEHEPSTRARFLEAYKESAELEKSDRAAALGGGGANGGVLPS